MEVTGKDASDVQAVARALADDMSKHRASAAIRSPWVSGSFYLTAAVILVVLLLVVARSLSAWLLPAVILGGLIAVSVVGAFQLRHDRALSEKNFLRLMLLTFRQFPLIGKSTGKHDAD